MSCSCSTACSIGAGDQRYLAKAMVGALVAFVPAAVAVRLTDRGIGWLWAALAVLMSARLVALLARWRAGHWAQDAPAT